MGEELSLDSILSMDELDIFDEDGNELQDTSNPDEKEVNETIEDNKETKETTEVNPEELFSEDDPEGVGSGKEDTSKEKEGTETNKGGSTSPNNNFYSSIANAFRDEGIFPDLEDNDIKDINSAEDFAAAMEKQIQAKFDERQRRIDDALNANVEPDEIKKYENVLSYLDSIDEDSLNAESEEGEKLRKELIYLDFINRGYSKERATREVKKSIDSGSDIEDAQDALAGNKSFFSNKYKEIIEDASREIEEEKKERQRQAEDLKKSILEDSKVFGDLSIDKNTRKKIYENISQPRYRDPESGALLTALQKYQLENRTEFLKNLGLVFTLTDGFKNLDGLVKGKVKKEVSKSMRELEHTLNNTSRTSGGNLKFASGVNDDPESFLGNGWQLDV